MIAVLQRLQTCHIDLIAALDANDVEAILASVADFRRTIDEMKAIGAWHENDEAVDLVRNIAKLSEAARLRVNILTDINQQRIAALAAARGAPRVPLYASNAALVA